MTDKLETEFPELRTDLAGLTEQQIVTVLRAAERHLECRQSLVKLEQRLLREAQNDTATSARRLWYLKNCVLRAQSHSRKGSIRVTRDYAARLRVENLKKVLADLHYKQLRRSRSGSNY